VTKNTLVVLLVAVNLLQALLLVAVLPMRGGSTRSIVVMPPPLAEASALLAASARVVSIEGSEGWRNMARLCCRVVERYGATAGTLGVDEMARGVLAGVTGGGIALTPERKAAMARLLRQVRQDRNEVLRHQRRMDALEGELVKLGRDVSRLAPRAAPWTRDSAPEGRDDPWRRLSP